VVEVNVHDFQEAVTNCILSRLGKDFLVNLSGGMSLLTFDVFIAFLLTKIDAKVEGETEDFVTTYSFRIKDISPLSIPLTKDHIEVLKVLNEGFESTNAISKRTGIPLTSTWRKLNEPRKEGLIDDSNRLTTKGKMLVRIYTS